MIVTLPSEIGMREKLPILNRPLRVLHIISGDLWAGAESQAFTLLKHLNTSTALHVVVMNDGELSHRLRNLNIPVTVISESELSSFKILTRLVTVIKNFKPNIIHTHRQKENILGSFANILAAIPFKKRAASVRTAHGAPEFEARGKQRIQVCLDNWAGKYLQQAIIAVSEELAGNLKNIFPAEKIHVIHNGVDPEALQAQATPADFLKNAPDYKHVGIIGRIEPVKRVDIFIDMANLLMKDKALTQKLKFHIIGDGSLRAVMEDKITQLELDDHLYFHGHRTDIASCVKSLDFIVMCSDHEGTPMTALESLALGTALVAHRTGGLKEILAGSTALLVEPNTPDRYAHKIQQLLLAPVSVQLNEKFLASENARRTLSTYEHLTSPGNVHA